MNALTINNINPVSASELIDIARITFTTGRFLFVGGQGGAGKTSIAVHTIAPALGLEPWLVNLSGQGPQECLGYGIPQANGDMIFAAPEIWPTEKRVGDRPVLLILDELPDYDPAVRALLRGLFPASGSRYVGPHKLGSGVRVLVTGNRRMDGTRSAVEDAPFTERCVKVTLTPNVVDWLQWYNDNPATAASGSHVPTFLRYGTTSDADGQDHFNPPVAQPYDGAPHPCPRTWEAIALAEPFRKTEPRAYAAVVKGSVGDRAASAYLAFLQHVDRMPDVDTLRADAAGFAMPSDPASQYALVSACLATAKRGIADTGIAVAAGKFDWLIVLLQRVRGDIAAYGYETAVRRGIPLDQHSQAYTLRNL